MWLILSSGYIGWNIWSNFRLKITSQAYQQGIADAVNQIIQEAENIDCKPVRVFNKGLNKDIQLINTNCNVRSE